MKKGRCEIQAATEAVKLLSLQEATVSLPFLFSKERGLTDFLVSVEDMAVDRGCDFPLKWFLHCITARFSKSDRDFLNDFVKMCLNWYDEPPAKLLLNFLFENREIPDMDDQLARYFANAMFQFAQKHPVLIRCMPQVQRLVHAVGNERLLKYLGIHAFPFYFDCDGIREHLAIRDLTTDEVRMILMSNCRRSIWVCVQDVHFRAYQYPFDFPDAFSPALCSLTSSSVAMRIHFFDVVAGSVKKCLEDLNLDAIPLFIRTCPVVAPFLIVAYHSIIYRNPLKYARLIMASVSESVASHIIERFRNDVRFLEAVRPPKVAEMPIDYVTSHSIPFLFLEKLSDDQALEFTEKKYYIYDEQATAQDRDFLLSLRILWAVLELISMQKLTSRAIKETGARVKQYLESLQAPSKICIDLFSLIFLRDKVGNFICHASIARQIVKLVNSFCPNVYVKRAISCLFNQKIRGVSSDINDYWTSARSDFLNKLAQKNFDVAKAYISIEPTLRREYVLSWSMNSLETESSCLVECSMYKTELNLELGMSNPHFSECLSYSLEHVLDDFLKLAIRNRLSIDPSDWLKQIPCEQWERMVPIARNLDTFPSDFFATRQFSRFRSILTKSILDFVKYLDLYYRCRLLYGQVTKKRLENLLEFNPLSALQGAFNVDDYQKAQKIAGLFGINLFVYVLERPSKFRIKKKTLDYFRDQYELECMALLFDAKRNNLFDHRRLSGILERYWRTTKKHRSLQSRIHKSSSWSDLIEEANLAEVTSQGSTADLPRIDESILEDENPLKKSQSLLLPEDAKAPQQDSSSSKQKRVILTGTEAGKPQTLLHRRRQSVDWDKGHKDGNRGRLKPQRVESDTSSVLHLHFQMQIPIEESEVLVTRPSSTGDLSKIEGLREETELANRLLELLQNPETDPRDLDDYIYRISPKRYCNLIIENIDTISHMLAGYVCEVCCYSEELSRKRIVQSLLVRRKIEKVTSADDDDGIVGELVQLRRYKLAAEFIRRFARDKESLVVKYVRKLLTNTTELRNFMMALPDFFEVIASDVDEAIPVMADFCPDSIRPAFLAFESLPVEVRIVSSLVDRSTIAKAFCSGRIDLVRYLRRQHLVLFSDEDLTAVLAESARTCIFKYFAKDAVHLSSLVRNKALFIDICSDRVQREINEINVSCIEDEFEASLLIDKMFAFSQFCALREPVARMLRNLVKFFDHKPYSRTHIPYNFNSPSLFEICFELDLDELAFEFTAVDKDAYIAKRVSTELYLGRFEDANDFLARQRYEFNNVPIEYLNPFLHKEVFYYEGIDMMIMNGIDCFKFRGEPAQMPFYRMIVASCRKMKKTLRIGELHTFLDRWCDFRTRIKFYTQFGEISRTVDILKDLPVESILEVIPMMLETSVAFKYQTRLMKELARCDGAVTESVWKALSAYLNSRNMNYILSEAYLARGQLEDVAQVSYRLCTESPLISNKVFHIANAVNALLESEKQSERKVSRTMEMSEEERQNMKDVFQLLYDVYNFLYRQHVVELRIEDRDHDPDGVIVTGSLLVELKNEELLERFVSTFQISKAKIFAHFFDKMSAREPQDVIAYVDATKNDKGFWAMYHHEFVRSLACSKNSSIIAIVIHDICPPDQVIGLLLECDRLKEAYTCAINKNNLDLLPLIAFRASQLGDTDLVRFCEKHF